MTEHDYKATVAAFRNAADLAAEVERLTAERDAEAAAARRLNDKVDEALEQVGRLRAERDELRCEIDGCGCPAPYDTCPHSEPWVMRVDKLTAEVAELRQANGGLRASAESAIAERRRLTAEVDRLTAEHGELREQLFRPSQFTTDPDAPPIPCVEVDATDGRRTWRAMGEDVRTLGDEWWFSPNTPGSDWLPKAAWKFLADTVYLVRRSAPRTVAVELPEDVAKRFADPTADLRLTATDEAAVVNACRAALTEAGDR